MTSTTLSSARVALIADDDEDLRDLMAETMELLGYSAIVVNDGKSCIEKLREQVPVDVVFLDLKMANQDGLTTLKLMRSFPNAVRHLPAFMLTGYVVLEPVLLEAHKETLSTIYFEDKGQLASLKDPVVGTGFKVYPLSKDDEKWLYVVKQDISPKAIITLKPEHQVSSLLIYKKETSGWRCVWPSYRQVVEASLAEKEAPKGLLGELIIA